MEDKIIDFTTAKLVNKKNFDIIQKYGSVSSLYDKKGKHVYYSNYGFMYSGLSDGYISAPTQGFLQRWLREKHGLIMWVEFNEKTMINKWCYKILGRNKVFIGNSYEECLEKGLINALKLI